MSEILIEVVTGHDHNDLPQVALANALDLVASVKRYPPSWQWCTTLADDRNCGVWLRDGTNLPCAAVAQDILGGYTVVLLNGTIRQYLYGELLGEQER
jgi:hypothetical protein